MDPWPWRKSLRLWRRNMVSQRCWNLLDISISRGDTLECTRRFRDVKACRGRLYKESAWMTEYVLIDWYRLGARTSLEFYPQWELGSW
ncbi:hypothetical protein AVEN_252982-1 [Araneus ventricosus]|uniref:Uncharacterized protein n=1 Tax=Araneus ventricosus TaxID=182803 RepID=A0A4Y2M745_ARAVE|nr:hypothetical protein AVEN_252982-1 [Araneus ventricosus]